MSIKTIFEYINKKRLQLFWIILIIIIALLFLCFQYSDLVIMTKQSINLIKTLYDGHPLGFYKLNYGLIPDKFLPLFTCATYDIPLYIIFAIWNIPVFILQSILNIKPDGSIFYLIWAKSILILFLGLSISVIKKICHEIKINKKNINLVIFTFLSSPFLLLSLFIINQYDIIEIYFILIGLLMYLKGNKKWFIIWFSIAITLKLFALFIFIPLVLLKEKKIGKIIKQIFVGVAPLIFFKIISSFMYLYNESTSVFTDEILKRVFSVGINVNMGNASLFCISLIAIALFCYLKNIKDKDEFNKFAIYIPLLVFTSLFCFVNFHPYWIVLLAPFMSIIIFQNMKYFKINIILDIFSYISFVITTIFVSYGLHGLRGHLGPIVLERMFLPKIFGSRYDMENKRNTIVSLLSDIGLQKYIPFFLALFVVCLIAIIVINFPSTSNDSKKDHKIEWGLLFTRMMIILPVPILMVICYYCR